MTTYKEYRRENLLVLEKKFGSLEELSDAVGVSASYLSQMKKVRHMGDKIARRFEKRLGLPDGVMDMPPSGGLEPKNTHGGFRMSVPHFSPDMSVQELIREILDLPVGLRRYMLRKASELKFYAGTLTPFQRNNLSAPPEDEQAFSMWEKELEAELDRAMAAQKPPAPDKAGKKKAKA